MRRRLGSTLDENEGGSEIEALKNRVLSLKTQLQTEGRQHSPLNAHSCSSVNPETAASGEAPADQSLAETPASRSNHEAMENEVAYLSLSAMAEQTDSRPFSAEGLSYLSMLYAATGVSGSDPTLPLDTNACLMGPLAELRPYKTSDIDLSSPEMQTSFQDYIDMIRESFPYITTSEISRCYTSTVTNPQEDHTEDLATENQALVYLGTATGLLLGSHYEYKELLATELAVKAVRLMQKIMNDAGQLSFVRCLTALTIFSMYTTFGGSTWHLLGLTTTRCISAGMHTSRLSNPQSGNYEQRQSNRLLWTLYIIDTYVSMTLDRPFCLNDRDIMVSHPPSPLPSSNATEADIEGATFRYLIQYAQIIRSIRQTPVPDTGILCHFINIHHWKEIVTSQGRLSPQRSTSLCTRGYVEILKNVALYNEPERGDVLAQATCEFSTHLDQLEEQLNSHSGAVASLDAFNVFAIGVILGVSQFSTSSDNFKQSIVGKLFQVQNILTLLSARYSTIRKHRDIISELQRSAYRSGSGSQLHELVARSDLAIPYQLQRLCTMHLS